MKYSAIFLALITTFSACKNMNSLLRSDNNSATNGELRCNKTKVGQVSSGSLNEVSGISFSINNADTIYAHNDSGDGPKLYLMSASGAEKGMIELDGAQAADWEDMDVEDCGGKDCIYVADIGNNGSCRDSFQLYKVQDPKLNRAKNSTTVINFKYPGNQSCSGGEKPYDAEAFAINPVTDDKYIITKTNGHKLFKFTGSKPEVLKHVCDLEGIPSGERVTAADISDDGKKFLVRTYVGVYEFERICRPLQSMRKLQHYDEKQGEAIAYEAKSYNFYTISEGYQPAIYRFECQANIGESNNPLDSLNPNNSSTPSDQEETSTDPSCSDILPPSSRHSCEQQAAWGKCDRSWMLEGNYCAQSCGRCGIQGSSVVQ